MHLSISSEIADADIVLLGAGYSTCVTGGTAPLMGNFFADLDPKRYSKLAAFLSELGRDYHEANVEEALLHLDQIAACPPKLKPSLFSFSRDKHEDIRRELSRYCISRLCALEPCESGIWAVKALMSIKDDCTVITTNYDNLAERILSARDGVRHRCSDTNCHHCKMCRLLSDDCGCHAKAHDATLRWQGTLAKLHGSIAWSRCVNPDCCEVECLSPDIHCRPLKNWECRNCGQQSTPVIVLPSMAKHLNIFPEIAVMWNSAIAALEAAQSIVVFGFSFPTSDALLAQTIRAALKDSRALKRVIVIDRNPEPVVKRVASVLPERHVDVVPLCVPHDGSPPEWAGSIEASIHADH